MNLEILKSHAICLSYHKLLEFTFKLFDFYLATSHMSLRDTDFRLDHSNSLLVNGILLEKVCIPIILYCKHCQASLNQRKM